MRILPAAAAAAALTTLAALHPAATVASSSRAEPAIRARGTAFVTGDDRPFAWRGVTAFALLQQLADGRERRADAFLGWAAGRGFTVVRVLGMAQHLFRLSPAEGIERLPRLLRLAAARGLVVELVVFADSRSFTVDLEGQVDRVARAIGSAGNVVVELANENDHATQDPRLTDPDLLRRLRARLPQDVPVSLGSLHGGDVRVGRYGGGDYVTVHPARGRSEWQHVALTASLAGLAREADKPVVNDEPIGAAERAQPGRRSNDPSIFFGLGLLGRMAGVPTTFHCEDCLRAEVPGPTQDSCAAAFIEGSRLLPEDRRFSLLRGDGPKVLAKDAAAGAASLHVASDEAGEWIVAAALGATRGAVVPWAAGWTGKPLAAKPGIVVLRAVRLTTDHSDH